MAADFSNEEFTSDLGENSKGAIGRNPTAVGNERE